jgi:hypothetical protein
MQPVLQTAPYGYAALPGMAGMRAAQTAHALPRTAPMMARPPQITGAAIAGVAVDQHAHVRALEAKDKSEQRAIGVADKVAMVGMVGLLDLASNGVSRLLALGSAPESRWRAQVNAALRSPFEAMNRTRISDLGSGRFTHEFRQARQMHKARGGIADAKTLERLSAEAGKFHAQELERVAAEASRKVSPSKLTGALGWLENKTIVRFADWRAKAADARIAGELQTAANHLTQAPEQSWLSKQFRRPFTSANLNTYAPAVNGIGSLAEKSGATLTRGVIHQAHELSRQMLHGTTGTAHLQGARALESLHQAGGAAATAQGWRNVANGGFAQALKAIPRSLGRMNLMHGAFALASLGIIASKFFTTGRENRLERVALTDFAADVYGVSPTQVTQAMLTGKAAHPLVKQAATMSARNITGRSAYGAISNAAEVVTMTTMNSPAGMMLLPYCIFGDQMLKDLLIGEQNLLQAYQVLKQAETGKNAIEPVQKQQMVGALIAAVPGIARQGGIYNKMVKPMAAELVEKNLSLREMVQMIASPEKMQALAESVQAKMPAPAAKVAAAHNPAVLHGAAPAAKVSGVQLAYHGRVKTPQLATAKG